jgi:hypothetical protein
MAAVPNLCLICKTTLQQISAVISQTDEGATGMLTAPKITPQQAYLHHRNIVSLQSSVGDGCYICIRLWERVRNDLSSQSEFQSRCAISATRRPSLDHLPIYMDIWFTTRQLKLNESGIFFRAIASQGRAVGHNSAKVSALTLS